MFNMSHDIRTPMNAIIGYAELASRHLEDTAKLDRYLEKIQVCGEELLSLLNNVLNLARIENNKIEMEYTVSNVYESFENYVTMFQQQAESKNQTLSLTEQIMYPYVYMDAPHLSEICLNIISNAIKYTNDGGTISCNVSQTASEKEDWCNLIITVTDNGIGMSEEFQKHVFETFERERNSTFNHIEGSGIGMGITKKLVELMDGTIEVKSKQGEGSAFTVTIPCRKASEEDFLVKKNNNLRDKNCLDGVRILLVEDNEINREIAVELLTEEGCIVETAGDGVACIDMIEKAEADYYKIVLMDIQMPIMNGYDAALIIRKLKDTKKSRLPIIAMTANAFAEDVNKALSAGMNDHVAKPINMNILVPIMMKYLL
ncbi:MAG: ATP-binding protein [Anaerovoracaceae bacterium]|nr:ATP-binding protein [Bacillota bacterium]MDY5905617.1 ATP-binding protein [Anaerovoracaceae bacterium]